MYSKLSWLAGINQGCMGLWDVSFVHFISHYLLVLEMRQVRIIGILSYHSVSQLAAPETCYQYARRKIPDFEGNSAKGRLPGKSKCIRCYWDGPEKAQ